jgi:hypothetical protein
VPTFSTAESRFNYRYHPSKWEPQSFKDALKISLPSLDKLGDQGILNMVSPCDFPQEVTIFAIKLRSIIKWATFIEYSKEKICRRIPAGPKRDFYII